MGEQDRKRQRVPSSAAIGPVAPDGEEAEKIDTGVGKVFKMEDLDGTAQWRIRMAGATDMRFGDVDRGKHGKDKDGKGKGKKGKKGKNKGKGKGKGKKAKGDKAGSGEEDGDVDEDGASGEEYEDDGGYDEEGDSEVAGGDSIAAVEGEPQDIAMEISDETSK